MPLEEEKLNQNEWVRWLLNENHKAELWEVLAFWEKYRAEWKKMEQEFWEKSVRGMFRNLIMQYEDSRRNFEEWLLPKEKQILESISDVAKEKFYKEYLFDRIVYTWDEKEKKEWEKQGYDREKKDIEWFKKWVIDMKDKLRPWMEIELLINEKILD